MKKRYLLSGVGVGAGVAGFVLMDRNKRDKLKTTVKNTASKMKDMNSKITTTLEDAGVPDESKRKDVAQLENSKMVSEGSQFGVNYYNEMKDKETTK